MTNRVFDVLLLPTSGTRIARQLDLEGREHD